MPGARVVPSESRASESDWHSRFAQEDGVMSLRSVRKFTTSSFISFPFGVSRTFGILRKRGSFMIFPGTNPYREDDVKG